MSQYDNNPLAESWFTSLKQLRYTKLITDSLAQPSS